MSAELEAAHRLILPPGDYPAGQKVPVRKLDEATVRKHFPIADRVPGWFFRVHEFSAGAWLVEGTDLWGRTVKEDGHDERVLYG